GSGQRIRQQTLSPGQLSNSGDRRFGRRARGLHEVARALACRHGHGLCAGPALASQARERFDRTPCQAHLYAGHRGQGGDGRRTQPGLRDPAGQKDGPVKQSDPPCSSRRHGKAKTGEAIALVDVAGEEPPEQSTTALGKLFSLLRSKTGADFTYYKHATIMRRIGRRMFLKRADTLDDYVQVLEGDPAECAAL